MSFQESFQTGYTHKGESILLGAAMLNGVADKSCPVSLPLKTFNRHGLIAGATGTGKTKTLQLIAESLSAKSVPVLVMDIKGDLSGIAAEGVNNSRIEERYAQLGLTYKPFASPVEFLTLNNGKGTRLKATVSEFGPILLSKILDLNDTQGGFVSMIFKFCDDNQLPLLDLKDFIKVLQFISNEGKVAMEKDYGKISTTSTGTILRKVVELQQQGADVLFGEPSFEVEDLMRIDENGRGIVSILRVNDLQDKPKLFSTFMLCLLAELYAKLPEEGDLDQPKLCLFIDEAHFIFNGASQALLDQIETIIKLIRSKGVGIFFITQNPTDVPPAVLSQLGLKVQHALRAFTAADRRSIKQSAENFPESEFYKVDELLTQLGMGEAFITGLNEKGIPTPLAATLLCSPCSRMNVLNDEELDTICKKSFIAQKYNQDLDSHSAYEMLHERLEKAKISEQTAIETPSKAAPSNKKESSTLEEILSSPVSKQIARTAANVITRSLLGALGLTGSTRAKKKSSWF
ncbi:MAG: helicase HerA-like domain-containing protein [bacterium]|nr:helicase HerA-like domain-containing protein [bacterium]